MLTKVICIGQSISYLAIALSDPGIAQARQAVENGSNRTVYSLADLVFVVSAGSM